MKSPLPLPHPCPILHLLTAAAGKDTPVARPVAAQALRHVFATMRQDDRLTAAIERFVAAPPYEACLLLVAAQPQRLDEALSALGHARGWPEWRVGEALSPALAALAPAGRPAFVPRWFRDAAAARAPGPVLVADVALLFEPALRLDPLRLLRDAARQTQLVVAWPGAVHDGRLAYAVPDHAHFRQWPAADLGPGGIVPL